MTVPPLKTDPKYGYFPWWPEDGDGWVHPEDVAAARTMIPSHRVFRRDGSEGDYLLLHYGDVTLRVRPGQSVALVGSNGSGKTTLVKLLAGLYEPTQGTVRYQGRDLREWDPLALRQRIGVIFQDFNRYQLTVGENIGAGDVAAFDDEHRWAEAAAKGCDQVCYLDAVEHKWVEELGGMNLYFVYGDKIVTPALTGSILEGVTRDSLLGVARDLGYEAVEERVSVEQWQRDSENGTLTEVFACGTAASN